MTGVRGGGRVAEALAIRAGVQSQRIGGGEDSGGGDSVHVVRSAQGWEAFGLSQGGMGRVSEVLVGAIERGDDNGGGGGDGEGDGYLY